MKPRRVLILFFLLVLTPLAARAQSGAYTVEDVQVDIVAESAVKARNQAFVAAQENAFKMLSGRFMTPEEAARASIPSSATIANMVSDFEITSEQLSKKRYRGTYIFRFKAGPVNRYFGRGPLGGYDMAGSAGRQLLVIPVFSQNGQGALWDAAKNPWLQAWQAQPVAGSNLLVPTGEVADVMDLRETRPEDFTRSGLKRIRARYNAGDVVIASAVFDQKAKDLLKIDLYRTDSGKAEFVQSMPVPVGQAKKLGELLAAAVPQTKALLAANWKSRSADPVSGPYAMAAPPSSDPAPAPSPYQPQSGQVTAVARFNTMADWLTMRRALNGIPPLRAIRITALTTNQATMVLTYTDWMALTSALSARGFSLQSTGPGTYNLSRMMNTTGYPQ